MDALRDRPPAEPARLSARQWSPRAHASHAQTQAIKPVRSSCAAEQRNLDAFRIEYNTERPHERLQQQTPASQYATSPRPYPERLPALEYPRHFLVKKITTGGTFRFQHKLLYLANAMVDQHIGLEETDDGMWAIHFNTILLATFDERDYIITG